MTLGDSARKARRAVGLSMRQLAEKSGVSYSSIHNIENNIQTPSVLAAEALASALNITIEEYIGSAIVAIKAGNQNGAGRSQNG